MPRTRVFTRMVPNDADRKPAIRVEFNGKYQVEYFSIRKIAEEDFGTSQTALSRLILCEWARQYREKKAAGKPLGVQQMVMILRGEKPPKKEKSA
ncbi:MAG TPA: hypothetical protein VF077_12745 [Nitrospiraceae bacterium]